MFAVVDRVASRRDLARSLPHGGGRGGRGQPWTTSVWAEASQSPAGRYSHLRAVPVSVQAAIALGSGAPAPTRCAAEADRDDTFAAGRAGDSLRSQSGE